jgi:hypothetical protein
MRFSIHFTVRNFVLPRLSVGRPSGAKKAPAGRFTTRLRIPHSSGHLVGGVMIAKALKIKI